MNYTPKHHLPQWAKSDRIMMDDFNAAMANIESGLAAADSKAESARPYAAGLYLGTGEDQTIQVGFRPSFVFISSQTSSGIPGGTDDSYRCATTGNGLLGKCIQMTDTGFKVFGASPTPALCYKDRLYEYIAFK